MRTDAQIQKDVMDELKWEPAVNSAEIGVADNNGIVTLSGQVNTYSEKTGPFRADSGPARPAKNFFRSGPARPVAKAAGPAASGPAR